MYQIEYLSAAQQDMIDIVLYISHTLCNPSSAEKLAEEMVTAVEGLKNFPYSNPMYVPIRPLNQEYRKLFVQNYILFYWVDEKEKCITVARVIYARRDYEKLL